MGILKITNTTKTLTYQNIFIVATNRLGVTSDTSIPIVLLKIVKPPNFPPYFNGDLAKSLEINLEAANPGQEWKI